MTKRLWPAIVFAVVDVVFGQQNIVAFGAVPGVDSLAQATTNGIALAAAVRAANLSSSTGANRTVLIPAGVFALLPATTSTGFTGVSNLTVQLDGNLSAYTTNFSKHWPVDPVTRNPADVIHFEYSSGVTVSGAGTIEGNGYNWWWWVILGGYDNRPNLIGMVACAGCVVRGMTLRNSPQFHAFLMDMRDLLVEDVTVYVDVDAQAAMLGRVGLLLANLTRLDALGAPEAVPSVAAQAAAEGVSPADLRRWAAWASEAGVDIPTFPINTDGIDIGGTSIIVRNVTVTNYDDAIAVKPTNGNASLSSCSQDILVEGARIHLGVGLTIGSVPPDSAVNCVRNVTFRDSISTKPIKGLYVKTDPCFFDDAGVAGGDACGTGVIDSVSYVNITMTRPLWWGIYAGPQQQSQPANGTHTGCSFFFPLGNTTCPTQPRVPITRLALRNVTVSGGVLSPGLLRCDPAGPCTGWDWEGVRVTNSSDWPMGDAFLCQAVSGRVAGDNTPVPCINATAAPGLQ